MHLRILLQIPGNYLLSSGLIPGNRNTHNIPFITLFQTSGKKAGLCGVGAGCKKI